MKAVITGASGFLGRALAGRLLAEGVDVTGLTSQPDLPALDEALPILWQQADITNPASLVGQFDGAALVIHAAGMLGRFGVSDETYRQINAEGTRNVLAAVKAAVEAGRISPEVRLLHVSSFGVLGPVRPGQEDVLFDESRPLAPSNAYERSKALSEEYAQGYAAGGLPVVVARPEFVYGPGDIHVLGLFQAIQRGVFFYIGDGRNTCHPTYINDAVEGLLLALTQGQAGKVYNIAGPRPHTFRQLAETIAAELDVPPPRLSLPRPLAYAGAVALEAGGRLTGRDIPLSRTGVAFFNESRRVDPGAAVRELGYEPQVDLQEGIGRAVAWYCEQGLL